MFVLTNTLETFKSIGSVPRIAWISREPNPALAPACERASTRPCCLHRCAMTTDRISGELLFRWISAFRVPRVCFLLCLCASCATGVCAAPQTITCSTPQSIAPASTQGAAIGKLTIDPTQLDIKVFDSATASLSVVNQASSNIQKLSLSTLGLSDGKTGQSIPATAWEADFDAKAPLNLNQRTDCALTLPLSNHAGAFTGTLRIEPLPFSVTAETRVFRRLRFVSPDFMRVSHTLKPPAKG